MSNSIEFLKGRLKSLKRDLGFIGKGKNSELWKYNIESEMLVIKHRLRKRNYRKWERIEK